jgi:site-specific DNA-cytosine methylase
MKLLELFSGTGSVGKVAKALGWEVVSLDLKNADIQIDILDWDFESFPVGVFDFVWASPPCTEYSRAKTTGVRKIEEANKIVLKTIDIIKYLQPKYYVIENPQTGLLKEQTLEPSVIIRL